VLIYGGDEVAFDADAKTPVESRRTSTMLSYQGRRMPIYGRCLTFRSERLTLTDETSQQPAAVVLPSGDTVRVRIGYDLFREIGTVLTVGQPPANADIPVVEMHIGLLRDLIVEYAGPAGRDPSGSGRYRFIACLTHDVDHPSIRRHRLDHTMVGFLYRALVGSLIEVFADASRRAICSPTGRPRPGCRWFTWGSRRTSGGLRSLSRPRSGPGLDLLRDSLRGPTPEAPRWVEPRSAGRRATERVTSRTGSHDWHRGCEIGVHGIDAWRDSSKGRDELHEVARITGSASVGVRMHWLYATNTRRPRSRRPASPTIRRAATTATVG